MLLNALEHFGLLFCLACDCCVSGLGLWMTSLLWSLPEAMLQTVTCLSSLLISNHLCLYSECVCFDGKAWTQTHTHTSRRRRMHFGARHSKTWHHHHKAKEMEEMSLFGNGRAPPLRICAVLDHLHGASGPQLDRLLKPNLTTIFGMEEFIIWDFVQMCTMFN